MFSTRLVFPIDGPRGDDDEVAGLQAARHLVEVAEAGRMPVIELLRLEQLLDLRQDSCTMSRIDTKPSRARSSAMAKIACSAWSRIVFGFLLGLVGAALRILVAE